MEPAPCIGLQFSVQSSGRCLRGKKDSLRKLAIMHLEQAPLAVESTFCLEEAPTVGLDQPTPQSYSDNLFVARRRRQIAADGPDGKAEARSLQILQTRLDKIGEELLVYRP
jgi:hypothetical protein